MSNQIVKFVKQLQTPSHARSGPINSLPSLKRHYLSGVSPTNKVEIISPVQCCGASPGFHSSSHSSVCGEASLFLHSKEPFLQPTVHLLCLCVSRVGCLHEPRRWKSTFPTNETPASLSPLCDLAVATASVWCGTRLMNSGWAYSFQ